MKPSSELTSDSNFPDRQRPEGGASEVRISGSGRLKPLPNTPFKIANAMFWIVGWVALVFPFLPIYLSEIGVSNQDIALIMSVPAITSLFSLQFWGYLADIFFRRTRIIVFCSLMSALVTSLLPWLPSSTLWISAGLFVLWLFTSPRSQMLNAIALSSYRGEEFYGPTRMMGSLGFAILVVFVGWLSDQPALGIAVMFPAIVIAEIMNVFSISRLKDLPPNKRHRDPHARFEKLSFVSAQTVLFKNPLIVMFLIFTTMTQMFHMPILIFQPKLLTDLGATKAFAMTTMALAALAEITVFLFGAWIIKHIRIMPLMGLAALAISVRWGIVWSGNYITNFFVPDPELANTIYKYIIMISNVLHIFTFGLGYLTATIFINREAPENLRSSGQTLYGIFFQSVSFFMGMMFAWVILRFASIQDLYGFCAVGALLALVTYFPMKRAYEKKHRVSGFWIRPQP